VQLRYNPDDRESVLVYSSSTGKYIGEAWLMGNEDSRYTITDVQQSRSQFRRGLNERIKDYVEEIARADRQRASKEDWDVARDDVANHHDSEVPVAEGDPDEQLMLDALIEQFNRQDAGKHFEEAKC
jgi:hypothetical protein